MARFKIVIPDIPPSWNVFAGRQNSKQYRDEKEKWTSLVGYVARVHRPPHPFDKALVKITYRFPDRGRRDPDNYSGKMLLDGLTLGGIIVDDSFRHIKLFLDAEDEPGPKQTTIIVEEVKSGVSTEGPGPANPDKPKRRAASGAEKIDRFRDPRKAGEY